MKIKEILEVGFARKNQDHRQVAHRLGVGE